jgi:magnesium transporter
VGQRTNEIMKYLTVMSAVFLPLAFVVGFFGQNFEDLPFVKDWVHSDRLMWGMVVTCIALPAAMMAWFRQKNWL